MRLPASSGLLGAIRSRLRGGGLSPDFLTVIQSFLVSAKDRLSLGKNRFPTERDWLTAGRDRFSLGKNPFSAGKDRF